jgi:hypothetical protein
MLDEYTLQDLLVTRPLLEELFVEQPGAGSDRRRVPFSPVSAA